MKSIATWATFWSSTPSPPQMRHDASSAPTNEPTRVFVHLLVHSFIHRFEARYPHAVDNSCRFLRPPVREATPLAVTRAHSIERVVAEFLSHRVECGIEPSRANVIEEPELLPD